MIVGPGDAGPYDLPTYSRLGDIGNSIRRFWLEAQNGDVVLLRLGTGGVLAVGEIADHVPEMCDAFADVDGWHLQHTRRVRWFDGTNKTFAKTTLGGQVRTFAEVRVSAVREWVKSLPERSKDDRERSLCALPSAGRVLEVSELARRLFVEGLASEAVDRFVSRLESLRRIASWYANEEKRPAGRPSEHETIAYLVLPLLFSLGWSEQTAAVEWHHVDVALFESMPSSDETLACVLEAKPLDRSVFSPLGQAKAYADRHGRPKCTRLVVTDGIRYALHRREKGDFRLVAYLSLLSLRDGYPAFDCAGAVQAIIGMSKERTG